MDEWISCALFCGLRSFRSAMRSASFKWSSCHFKRTWVTWIFSSSLFVQGSSWMGSIHIVNWQGRTWLVRRHLVQAKAKLLRTEFRRHWDVASEARVAEKWLHKRASTRPNETLRGQVWQILPWGLCSPNLHRNSENVRHDHIFSLAVTAYYYRAETKKALVHHLFWSMGGIWRWFCQTSFSCGDFTPRLIKLLTTKLFCFPRSQVSLPILIEYHQRWAEWTTLTSCISDPIATNRCQWPLVWLSTQ